MRKNNNSSKSSTNFFCHLIHFFFSKASFKTPETKFPESTKSLGCQIVCFEITTDCNSCFFLSTAKKWMQVREREHTRKRKRLRTVWKKIWKRGCPFKTKEGSRLWPMCCSWHSDLSKKNLSKNEQRWRHLKGLPTKTPRYFLDEVGQDQPKPY